MGHRKNGKVIMKAKATRSVVVIYEDPSTREEAVKFCDHLIDRFWADYEFDVNWLSFDLLGEPPAARDSGAKALGADFVIFATRPDGELPPAVEQWIESWAGNGETAKAHWSD